MQTVKWFSKAMTLGFVFFMALLLVQPENSLEFIAMVPFGAFGAYLMTNKNNEGYRHNSGREEIGHTGLFFTGLIGGMVMTFGAMLAEGNSDGNIMSGLILSSISSYAFVVAALFAAIPVAILLKAHCEGGN